jgi:hypothetical protein
MRKIATHLICFGVGIALVIALRFYSLHDLRYILSPATQFANGSAYKGPLNPQGQLEGHGKLTWTNGDEFEGEFVAGLFQGEGRYLIKGYAVYQGQFNQGYMEGTGKLVYENGAQYEGDFSKNVFNGKGKLINKDGSIYEGDFLNNEITGKGKWTFADKAIYVGEVKNGMFNGKGKLTRPDGSTYRGDFVDGKMHGHGRYKSHKIIYVGEFAKDNFTGKGSYKDEDGDIRKGTFLNWYLNGEGTKTDKEGNKWAGKFKYGQISGKGTYIGKDGVTYEGEFDYGQYTGKGKLQEKNGDVYEGEFRYGEKDGEGLITYKKPINGITKTKGRWKNGRMTEGDDGTKMYSAADVSDYAIYHQQAALNKELGLVQKSDPKKIELYSLVVAAYGTQEVFRRESIFIENLFSTQYQNRSTAIYLTNSQRSLDEKPFATLTGIKQSIQQLAEQMDKENDIFFLYITSHGSKDKKISLTHNGLGLGDIDSKWLGDILKNTGIKHKVIVLSACYSGGFIDDLKDDNSIIMTSASSDRTSFGCSDESDFTYFAKAYFKESLTPTTNFVDAFTNAKELVSQWEKSEKQKASNPQIYSASAVEEYVRNWASPKL